LGSELLTAGILTLIKKCVEYQRVLTTTRKTRFFYLSLKVIRRRAWPIPESNRKDLFRRQICNYHLRSSRCTKL